MSTTQKTKLVKSVRLQVETWELLLDSPLNFDHHALIDLYSKDLNNGKGVYFCPFAVPKSRILDTSSETWLEDLENSCHRQEIRFIDDRPHSPLANPRTSYIPIDTCERQAGDFFVFLGQLGQVRQSTEWAPVPVIEGEFPLSLSDTAWALCSQDIERLWTYNPNWWIAAKPQRGCPCYCFKFERNLSGEQSILRLTSLEDLFYYDPGQKSSGGFASAFCST